MSLPGFVSEALRGHRAAQNARRLAIGEAWTDLDLVVDNGDGCPFNRSRLSRLFRRAVADVQLDLTFHGLRHANASFRREAGQDMKLISDQLGHSGISITADRYTHIGAESHEAAAAQLDVLLAPAFGPN